MMTRQDHIDPLIREVRKCPAHDFDRNHPFTAVFFTNNEWVCSSGHVSSLTKIPALRSPELDPVAWCRVHSDQIAKQLKVEPCFDHNADAEPTNWMPDGHIWLAGNQGDPRLCLPRTVRKSGSDWVF